MENRNIECTIDVEGFVDFLKDILTEPPVTFNPNDFKDNESFENDTEVFMQGYNAAIELIVDVLLSILMQGEITELPS